MMKKSRVRSGLFFVITLLFLGVLGYFILNMNNVFEKITGFLQKDQVAQIDIEVENRYGRSQLDQEGKEVYDRVFQAVDQLQDQVRIPSTAIDKAVSAIEHYMLDTPEHYWIENYSYVTQGGKILSVGFVYNREKETIESQRQQLENRVEEIITILQEPNQSEYEKSKVIHDYIVQNTTYTSSEVYDIYTPYGTLVEERAVCQGYAKTYQLLARKMGLESIYVRGKSRGQNHGWNLVRIDEQFYHVDTTWDDVDNEYVAYIDYSYFHLTDEQIAIDHQVESDRNVTLPIADSIKENYFVKNNLLITDIYSQKDTIVSHIAGNINNGKHFLEIAFEEEAGYREAMENKEYIYGLLTEGLWTSDSKKRLDRTYFYLNNDNRRTLVFIFELKD